MFSSKAKPRQAKGRIWRSDALMGLLVVLAVFALHASTDLFGGRERRFYDLAYIAMEFLQGHDLVEHTRQGQLLSTATVLVIGERVALALDHAHRQQVVHRDIKPANVMYDPATESVKVTDFGIARIISSSKTKTGMVLGTPSSMSPEQLAGQHVDGRSDLYSLGVMLFQLLTGSLPLRGDSMAALMYQIANQSAPSVRALRPELPQELADILDKTLSKSPAQRYQTGGELAADLHRVIAVLPVSTDAVRAPDNTSAPTGQRDENAMLATVVTPAPVSSTVPERAGADIRL